ncbi:MAG: hypothetical protein K0V04_40025 [Deltaproteobacteria bacterium]|nr:hypothetical protein [Deltaproteobacteria bacterium]
MKRDAVDGRVFVPELVAQVHREGSTIELRSPAVGLWRGAPTTGQLVVPRAMIGELEVLGVRHRVRAPDDAAGLVLEAAGPRLARRPVAYGDVLLQLDPDASPIAADLAATSAGAASEAGGVAFRSPLSGRFYARAAPDKPPFVQVGDVIETGRTVALLEVMKTFNRIAYGGDGLPPRARVLGLGPNDEDDVEEGDVLLRIEPA